VLLSSGSSRPRWLGGGEGLELLVVVGHGARCTVRLASFCEGEASFGITRLYHNVQPSDQGRQGYRLSCDGIGFVNVPGAWVLSFGEGKVFPASKGLLYKAKSSD
jgi:hypothetical protein